MLIRDADIRGHGRMDLRVTGGRVAAIGPLSPETGERVVDAGGAALLPGLHDHHIHLAGLAARRASVVCGPPEVTTPDELAARLRRPGTGWLRGVLYHESVMGLPDARALDAINAARPLRIQHRGGRMWLLNSLALDELLAGAAPPPGLEREGGRFTGRLFDEDRWLAQALGSAPPDLGETSAELARRGVTGVTDMSPRNDALMAAHFAAQRASGALAQDITVAGELSLGHLHPACWHLGPAKLHLHEAALPDPDDAAAMIAEAHRQGRAAAIHCVTEVELVFALALFEQAGALAGDRIEHASVAAPGLVERIAGLGLGVCVQPHFVAERGDRYLADVEPRHHGDLYRLASLADAGIAMAGGSDAPFAGCDPWAAMAAAVSRTTAEGQVIGPAEALTAEAALSLYLRDPTDFACERAIAVDGPADLCLLGRPWHAARERLSGVEAALTLASGRVIHDGIDQPPGERVAR